MNQLRYLNIGSVSALLLMLDIYHSQFYLWILILSVLVVMFYLWFDKFTTGIKIFVSVIANVVSFFVSRITQLVDHFKLGPISQLINSIFSVLQKFLKSFNWTTNIISLIYESWFKFEWSRICFTITWFIALILPQNFWCFHIIITISY